MKAQGGVTWEVLRKETYPSNSGTADCGPSRGVTSSVRTFSRCPRSQRHNAGHRRCRQWAGWGGGSRAENEVREEGPLSSVSIPMTGQHQPRSWRSGLNLARSILWDQSYLKEVGVRFQLLEPPFKSDSMCAPVPWGDSLVPYKPYGPRPGFKSVDLGASATESQVETMWVMNCQSSKPGAY